MGIAKQLIRAQAFYIDLYVKEGVSSQLAEHTS